MSSSSSRRDSSKTIHSLHNDIEKGAESPKSNKRLSKNGGAQDSPTPAYYARSSTEPPYEEALELNESLARKFWDSFKRDPNTTVTPKGVVGGNGRVFDPYAAAAGTAHTGLVRKLKGRHLQMIAIGGSIGMFSISTSSRSERLVGHENISGIATGTLD